MTERALRRFFLVVMATLLSVGCVVVYSATVIQAMATYGNSVRLLTTHVLAIGLGLGGVLGCLALPSRTLRHAAKPLVLLSLGLLILVRLVGPEIGGAHRWFRLGRFSVQPSEFAQLALVLYLADFLARKHLVIQDFRAGFLPPILVTGLMAGSIVLQPDLGTAIVIGAVALLMLLSAKARWQHLGFVVAIGLVILIVLVGSVEYRRRRFLAFLDPWGDPLGAGFQIVQSYVALGSGGLFGQGIGASLQKLFYLPSAHTDFIFALIGEELGLVGTTAILGLFALFICCGIRMAHLADDRFHKYLICGCVGLIGCEAVVHMAVVTGLLPTKGLPLPLVSYGGTSMVVNLLACGFILRASRAMGSERGLPPLSIPRTITAGPS